MQQVNYHRHRARRRNLIILVPAIALVIILGLFFRYHKPATVVPKPSQATVTLNRPINLIATGDWIAHDSVNAAALSPNGTYDYMPMVSDFLPVFRAADIRFCNDPILNGGESLGVSGYPKFNSPTEFVTDMGKLGCNLINLASNHSFDFTQANINNSVTAWQNTPNVLAFAGENQNQTQHDSVKYFIKNGVKFAFLAYTTYSNSDAPPLNGYGVNIFSKPFASQQISSARQNGAKFIIVSMRWGTEYTQTLNTTQTEDAQWLADQGVNLVLGHGTHELQPVQWLSGAKNSKTLVWYGLGNFLHSQEPAATLFNGIALMQINPQSLSISKLGFLPIYMHYEWSKSQQAADDIAARTNLHLYLLEDANQNMINTQELNTTIQAQEQRISTTLDSYGVSVPLLSTKQYYAEFNQ